ncbi:hypothetical protein AB6A40_008351 [Gnathostoma spinigerum]|uniref:Mos1 transposase HTH domain-containing protein n=1 Tax=Gnathostoma spinigerum TaxID=75299 RepID=A0ABD6ER69_9BILA
MSKQDFQGIYIYEYKLGRNTVQTARNIEELRGEGSIDKYTVELWFQNYITVSPTLKTDGRGRLFAVCGL